MPSPRTCIVEGCDAEVTGRHAMCRTHWHMLPGRMRSSLSFTSRCARSPRADDAWQRACAVITKERRS